MKHALFDTYAIGSEKALFEGAHHLEIHEIFDYSSTYGIVLGAESGVLQKCFNMFKKKNIRDIFEKIEGNIDSIKVTGKKSPFSSNSPSSWAACWRAYNDDYDDGGDDDKGENDDDDDDDDD